MDVTTAYVAALDTLVGVRQILLATESPVNHAREQGAGPSTRVRVAEMHSAKGWNTRRT